MMKAPGAIAGLSILLLLSVLQDVAAEPRPDFAIKATIAGSPRVVTLAGTLSTSFDKLDNLNVPLDGGYNLLSNLKTAILNIGSRITTAGMAISTAVNTLALNSTNNVNPVFDTVYSAINALRTLLQTGLTAQLAVLQQQDHYITTKLNDGFPSIITKLGQLTSALDRIKAGVIAARDAPGNSPTAVTATNVRKFVTAKMVTDVQDALVTLNSEVPLIQYILDSTQKSLGTADAFLKDMKQESITNVGEVSNSLGLFKAGVTTISEGVSGTYSSLVAPVYAAQLATIGGVQSAIEAIATYPDDLQPALSSLELLLDATGITTQANAIKGAFTTYSSQVDASIASLSSVEGFFVAEACEALADVIGSLVEGGYYASFCFSKYSPRLFNQFALTFYTVSECYEIELVRLQRLQDLMALIIDLIVYDIEDLGEAIATCAPLADGAPCITLIGPFYEVLATTIDEKQAYMLSYITRETGLSLNRVSSCVTVAKYAMVTSIAGLSVDLAACTVDGPGA